MDSQVTFGLGMDIDTSRIDRLADSLETILKSLEKSMGMLDNKTFLKDQIDQVNILVTKLKEFKDILNSTSVKNTNPMDNISKEVKNTEQEIKKLQGTVDSLNTTEPMRRFNNLQNIVSKVSKDLDTAYKKFVIRKDHNILRCFVVYVHTTCVEHKGSTTLLILK